MSEYTEKQTIVRQVPVGNRPIVETQYDSVVEERPGMSGLAVALLIVAAVAAAVVITMLIINSQQRNTDEALMQERAKTAAAQQAAVPPSQQQPVIVNVPASQTAAAPVVIPGPPQSASIASAPSSVDVEMDVNSRLMDDQELRTYAIDVKVSGGTATLSGHVQNEDLRTRAEKLARTVKGVRGVVNNITLQP
jgi:osmotically-inducible protein OsmY